MRVGIERGKVRLRPAAVGDIAYVEAAIDRSELAWAFGYGPGRGKEFARRRAQMELAVVERTGRRVGFVAAFPPSRQFSAPELAYAIVHRRDRDGFTAIAAADAWVHYLLDHLRFPELGFRTRADNLPALAVLRRLGYPPGPSVRLDGMAFRLGRIDRAAWARRRAQLERHGSPFRYVSAESQGNGARRGHGWAASHCPATDRSRSSAPSGASRCRPMGRPSADTPIGTEIAGRPTPLASGVKPT